MKITTFSVRASRSDAARWSYWARRARFPSVGAWLAVLAAREVSRREVEAVGFSIRC